MNHKEPILKRGTKADVINETKRCIDVAAEVAFMAMDMEFDYSGGWFEETGGSHMPVAISFDVNEKDQSYTFKSKVFPRNLRN